MQCPNGHLIPKTSVRLRRGQLICPICRKLDISSRAQRESMRKLKQRREHPSVHETGAAPKDGPKTRGSEKGWTARRDRGPDDSGTRQRA